MSQLGHLQTFGRSKRTSALFPRARHVARRYVSFGPETDSYSAAKTTYSITLSALRINVAGTSRPIALAVFRLIISMSFVAC